MLLWPLTRHVARRTAHVQSQIANELVPPTALIAAMSGREPEPRGWSRDRHRRRPLAPRRPDDPENEGTPSYCGFVRVRARLDGDPLDLQTLAQLFSAGDTLVLKDDDSKPYYLTSPVLDAITEATPDDAVAIDAAARQLLEVVNGLGSVRGGSSFQPVRLVGRYWDGTARVHAVVVADTIAIRCHVEAVAVVTGTGGPLTGQPARPAMQDLRLAAASLVVDEALRLLGQSRPHKDFFALYKVYEIIRDDISPRNGPTKKEFVNRGWCTDDELVRFVKSANDQSLRARAETIPAVNYMRVVQGRRV
jgi:hypothetical protein